MKGPTSRVLIRRTVEDLNIALAIIENEILPEVDSIEDDEEYMRAGSLKRLAERALELRLEAENGTWTKRN